MKKGKHALFLLLLSTLIGRTKGQQRLPGCPLQWQTFGDSCYRFVFDTSRSYREALSACWVQGSALVSVNNKEEHIFIVQFLNSHGHNILTQWYTSGAVSPYKIKWNGDGTYTLSADASDYWNSPEDYGKAGDKIFYQFSSDTKMFGWSRSFGIEPKNFICEIPKAEVFRIVQQTRDFGFGNPGASLADVTKGPQFLINLNDIVVVGSDLPLLMDCVAVGNPQPKYKWYLKSAKGENNFIDSTREITPTVDSRYTFSNGRLIISNPNEGKDAGIYFCQAYNQHGSIITPPIEVSFGFLNQFSPNQQGFVQAQNNQGMFLNCIPPTAKPGLSYQWLKGNIDNFIRPELNTYFFISANGNLYLSEVQSTDAGNYYCVVTLVPRVGERLSTAQPPSRTSLPIELRVPYNPSLDFGPIIHPDFIAVFPKPPLIGYNVRLECFAYGRMPLRYKWDRQGQNFPAGVQFLYDKRVMIIPNATFADGGNYTCAVETTAGAVNIDTRSIILTLEAKPFFVFPLPNVHADVESELTWRCEADGVPHVTYTWFKNSEVLTRVHGEIEVRENVLFIRRLDKERDEGMYQCMASNAHGTSMSSAQLRVLSIKPSFAKHPLPPTTVAADGGNMTIYCSPEAAPQPEITWLHNNAEVGHNDNRKQILLDGTLHVTQVNLDDQGIYTCKATNQNGEDQSSTSVTVMSGMQFYFKPMDTYGIVNTSIFLFCEASYDYYKYDLTYVWKFNNKVINTHTDFHYKQGTQNNVNGLYIINAQYKHTGVYECNVETVFISISSAATVTVKGPPSEPAGVYVETATIQNDSMQVVWTWHPAAENGFPVLSFQIEAFTAFSDDWTVSVADIPQEQTIVATTDSGLRRAYIVQYLLPDNSYRFRIRATNDIGIGPPSKPSGWYKVPSAPPIKAPQNVGGGGGNVGMLSITWQSLSRSEEGGEKFGYKVYWRKASDSHVVWTEKEVGNVASYVHTVGEENYYLPYYVQVRAYNGKGDGPLSTIATVYSASAIPIAVPKNVRCAATNSTAMIVTWDPLPNTRDAVQGRLLGYEVDYWDNYNPDGQSNTLYVYCTECAEGLIIGLDSNSFYASRLEVVTEGGVGPLSEIYLCETYQDPPGRYPQYVDVFEHGEHSVFVQWRGVNIIQTESTLLGYKIIYYPIGDNILTANTTVVGLETEAVVDGLQKDIIYNLRVLAYNTGGDGKKSPTVYFSILKDGAVANFDPSTTDIIMSSDAYDIFTNYFTVILCSLLTSLVGHFHTY